MSNKDNTLDRPENLSSAGKTAYKVILQVLREHDSANTGGCQAFFSPQEWEDRGESYGTSSELVVVYDGSDLRPFFNMDAAYPHYTLYEEMQDRLAEEGLYFEECTGWYCGVYKV